MHNILYFSSHFSFNLDILLVHYPERFQFVRLWRWQICVSRACSQTDRIGAGYPWPSSAITVPNDHYNDAGLEWLASFPAEEFVAPGPQTGRKLNKIRGKPRIQGQLLLDPRQGKKMTTNLGPALISGYREDFLSMVSLVVVVDHFDCCAG